MRLSGKTAVITGGNSGIGLGIAKEFINEGASVTILGRNRKTLDEAAEKLGKDSLVIQGDITKMADIENLYDQTESKFGKIDVLVVNAGGASVVPFSLVEESIFDDGVDLNFKGTFFTIQKALPHLNDNASIIIVSSVAHRLGFPGMSVYGATKAAIRSLARTISAELLPERGIRVNVVSPGPIETPIFDRMGIPEDQVDGMKESFKSLIPLKRFGTTEEIAKTVLFLASSESSFIVGEDISVDGGIVNLGVK
ncbi:MAG: SDR family oxidoreductase [Candidatus Marinimicrobia bacterium]|nr:SDR family oxidoreductase [Candidatus Neomarinimicrobiota bacterium]